VRVLSLFAGIGGFDLGLARAGMQTVAFCEIDPFARAVLAKHWPEVPIYEDIRTLTADWLAEMGLWPDVICGGFPCQDLSYAGKGAGISGERSGLWREYARLIGEIRPRYVIVENVAALLGRGLGDVLGDLAALGYDAEWHCIPASAVGAPHRRDRIWIIAHARGQQYEGGSPTFSGALASELLAEDTDATRHRRGEAGGDCERYSVRSACGGEALAYTNIPRLALGEGIASHHGAERKAVVGGGWWDVEPDVGRVANGVPARVDRLRSLGNAVVPQIPEIIGRAIMGITQ